jgi:hypothetical protein
VSASTLRDICFDCTYNTLVARFWAEMLGYPAPELDPTSDQEESICINSPEGGLRIWFNAVPEPKVVKNRVHLDVNMPDAAELGRLIALGATPIQEIRGEDGRLHWMIMADPEGNEFCAFPPTS